MMDYEERSIEKLLSDIRSDIRFKVSWLYQLSDLGPDEIQEFREGWSLFDDEHRRVVVRHMADITEGNFTVDFSEIFALCLSDDSAAVRLAALDGLWDCDRLALIQPIIGLMTGDSDIDVQATAAATLGHYVLMAEWDQIPRGSASAVVEALLILYNDPGIDPKVRRAALESLGASSDPRVSELIETAYDGGDHEMRLSALFAMGRSADSRWIGRVRDSMLSESLDTRLEAVRAAGGIAHSDAVSELADLVYDDDFQVRLAAVESLGKIGTSSAVTVLEELSLDSEAGDLADAIEEAMMELTWLGEMPNFSLMAYDDELFDEDFIDE